MRAWTSPGGRRTRQLGAPRTAGADPRHAPRGRAASTPRPEGPARLYVCGITPYDATHLGHAATYVAFDLLNRAWRDAGHEVRYVQNVTDVDDPLLERADATVESTGSSSPSARPSCSAQDMTGAAGAAAGRTTSAPSSRSRSWSTLIERLRRPRARLRRRRRPLLLGARRPGASARCPAGPRARCSRSSPSAAATPTAPGKKDPLDCLLWRGRAAGRAGLGLPVRAAAARLAHRVRRDRAAPPRRRRSTSRAAAATWSSRTTR